MPKAEKEKSTRKLRHNPLARDIQDDQVAQQKRPSARAKKEREDEEVLPPTLSKSILKMAKEQFEEEDEDGEEIEVEMEEEEIDPADLPEVDQDGFVFSNSVTADEERALGLFMNTSAPQGKTLADLIMEKIDAKEAKERGDDTAVTGLAPKVVKVYTEIGTWMKRFKSGKLPKAFKIIPKLINWEEILYLTNPIDWSANATCEATKLFASGLNNQQAQRFFTLVLLPAVRQDIADNKRLNFHLYQALAKAIFKPQGFLRGMLLPLALENCTLQEAAIMSSVLKKVSIPPLHSAAAIVKLCELKPWYGSTSVFLTAFIEKKYALPSRALEALVAHFASFTNDPREMPVLWHQSLLCFAQRYKLELSPAHKNKFKALLKNHFHPAIGPEVRRELFLS